MTEAAGLEAHFVEVIATIENVGDELRTNSSSGKYGPRYAACTSNSF